MNNKLIELAKARANSEELKAKQKEMLDELQQSQAWTDIQLARTGYQTQIENLEAEIKAEAMVVFDATGEKKQQGVTVKEFTVVKITDEAKAREWCMTNFRPALKLDTKTFEKAAQDGTVPAELATIGTEPRAQIASDLNEYLL